MPGCRIPTRSADTDPAGAVQAVLENLMGALLAPALGVAGLAGAGISAFGAFEGGQAQARMANYVRRSPPAALSRRALGRCRPCSCAQSLTRNVRRPAPNAANSGAGLCSVIFNIRNLDGEPSRDRLRSAETGSNPQSYRAGKVVHRRRLFEVRRTHTPALDAWAAHVMAVVERPAATPTLW
jgi:hypothetical protein